MLGNHYNKNAPKCSTSSLVEYNAKVVWKSVKLLNNLHDNMKTFNFSIIGFNLLNGKFY